MRFARPVRNKLRGENAAPLVRISNGARGFCLFSYGLFTIAAQSLLFREFITTFEGNDISVGIFFGSWFLWIGLAATLVYKAKPLADILLRNIELLFLCYLPAFIFQLILIIQARQLAGIESYTLWSARGILLSSLIINAPVSIVTGLLFPTACRWIQSDKAIAVSRVYILEAAGSFLGGLGVTILLAFGVNSARIFFVLAIIISSAVFAVLLGSILTQDNRQVRKILCVFSFLLGLAFCICLAAGADKALMRYVRVKKWTKLLPQNALIDSFQTPQAEYFYGNYQGQWIVMSQGSVCEALPDKRTAGRTAAVSLCQNPGAERVLVVGSGLALCSEFLQLPQIKNITWAHPDTEYARQINAFLPAELRINDSRFDRLGGDVRLLLAEKGRYFDIVILNLPDATSSVFNRYYTLEFYDQVKQSLRPGGVLAVRITGGENIMGTELINLGASTKRTLEKVFARPLVLTPGEGSWFIASDSDKLTGDPATLRDRFAAIDGADDIFPANALLSVYLPGRAAAALENYSSADLPEDLLINRDSRPLTHLYSLLLAAKQSGAPITRLIKHLALAGPLAFLLPLIVLVVLRAVFVWKTNQQGGKSSFDSTFLVFSAGWVGIGVVIVLMHLYQTRFGSLYLYIGVISSLFMAGLTAGAILIRRLLRAIPAQTKTTSAQIMLFAAIAAHILILAAISFRPAVDWTHMIFAIAFVLCGLCAGCYFPLAAAQLAEAGFETGPAGSKLETADHLGASAGGILTALVLVPVFGTKITLLVFVLLILANIPLAALRIYMPQRICSLATTGFRFRRLGYILFGVGLSIVLCSNMLAEAAARLRPALPRYAAQALAGELSIEKQSTVLQDSNQKINYFRVHDVNDNMTGYIFSSQELAPAVRGFGGKINLAIYVDPAGRLNNFHIIRSNETPGYIELLSQWRNSLNGSQLFGPESFADVQAVSGATVSSEAILSALQISGNKFTVQVLGSSLQPQPKSQIRPANILPDMYAMYLISAVVFSLVVIYRGGFRSRLVVLVFNLVLGGIILNAQYSSEQIATILSLHTPAAKLTGAYLLVVGIPALVLIFGNIYCGYICPFGAAQELLGYIIPAKFKQPIPAEKMKKARFIKYVILFILVLAFFLSRNRTTLTDPLISIFNFQMTAADWALAGGAMLLIAVIGAIFFSRFWCRYLCPVGAGLSLLNGIAVLKRYLPAKKFGRCEFGLTAKDQMDCIQCDRCRYTTQQPAGKTTQENPRARILLPFAVTAAILISTVSAKRFLQVTPVSGDYSAAFVSSGGQPRDVDSQRIRTLIEQKKLSDREAEFYKKIE